MKTYIKLFSIFTLCSAFLLAGISCSKDDGYYLNEYWKSMATVNKISDDTYDLTLDTGERLWIAAPEGIDLNPKYKRAIIDYTILSDKKGEYDHYIRLNSFSEVLTKDVVYIAPDNAHQQDSIGHDPIQIHSIWEGGGFLNIYFGYNYSGKNTHLLNLVSSDQQLSVNDTVVELEFRHNDGGDPQSFYGWGYVCFDLTPYRIAGRDQVKFNIAVQEAEDEKKTYTLVYTYKTAKNSQIHFDK